MKTPLRAKKPDSPQGAEFAEDKFAGGFIAAVEIDGTEDGLESVAEGGRFFASAVFIFTVAEDEIGAEVEGAAAFGESGAVDEFGAGFGERAFVVVGKAGVKIVGEDEGQDGVAEKFETLVGLGAGVVFVGNGRVREGEAQQRGVGKSVAEAELEGVEVCHAKNVLGFMRLSRRQSRLTALG